MYRISQYVKEECVEIPGLFLTLKLFKGDIVFNLYLILFQSCQLSILFCINIYMYETYLQNIFVIIIIMITPLFSFIYIEVHVFI